MSVEKLKKCLSIMSVIILLSSFLIIITNNQSIEIINPDDYKPQGVSGGTKFVTLGNKVIGGIQFLGSILSVIVLIIIGVKYIIGSAEEKAEYKETMMPYIIGAIMVFAISNILATLAKILK